VDPEAERKNLESTVGVTPSRSRTSGRRLIVMTSTIPLLAAALVLFQIQRLRNQAPAAIAAKLSAAFGAQATARDVELDFAHAALVVHGIEVRSGARTLLKAAELRARPAFGALMRGGLELQALTLPSAEVTLNEQDLARLAGGDAGAAQADVNLSVRELRLRLELGERGRVELERAELTVSNPAALTVALVAPKATWTSASGEPRGQARLQLRGRGTTAHSSGPPAAPSGAGELLLADLQLDQRPFPTPVTLNWKRSGAEWAVDTKLNFGAGELGVRADLTGSLSPLTLSGEWHANIRNLRVQAIALAQLTATGNVRLDDAGVRLQSLRIELPHSRLDGHASSREPDGISFDLQSSNLDFADFGSIWGVQLAGRGSGSVSAQLGGDAPTVRSHIEVLGAAIGGKSLGGVTADLSLDPRTARLRVEHAIIASPERHLAADGSILDFDARGLTGVDARLHLLRLPLDELYRVLGAADDPVLARLQGRAAGTAELTYRRDAPDRELDLALALQLSDIDLASYPFDRGRLSARIAIPDRTRGLAAGTLALEQLSLGAGTGTLELRGDIRRGKLEMRLGLRGLPLERAPWLRARAKPLLTGRIDGSGTLGGEAANTRADLRLGLEGLRLLGEPLGRVQLQALLRGAGATAMAADTPDTCRESRAALSSGALRGGSTWLVCGDGLDGRLRVDLALGNAAARPVRGRVSLEQFALGPFLQALQPSAADRPSNSGTLSAALELTGGGLADPERLSGTLRVTKLALRSGDMRLENPAPFELRARSGVLELEHGRLDGPNHHFVLAAAGSLGSDGRLTADGQLPSSVFTRDSEPLIKSFGNVAIHLEWLPGARPALRGRAEFGDLALRLPAAIQARRLRGALVLRGDRLELEGVEAELGDGTLAVSGKLNLEGLRVAGYDLAIEAKHVALEPEPMIQLELDASAKLRWAGGAAIPDLAGRLNVRRLVYNKPLHLEMLGAVNRSRPTTAARAQLNIDLTVEQTEPMRVRNTLLDGELAIAGADRKLRIVGTDQRVGVLGQLAITRGRLLFQGDRFHFTRGDIALTDATRIAPSFDVRAVADQPKRQNTSVVLSAQGTRDAFKVAIQCDAGAMPVDAPPFTCKYARDRMVCDDFDRLVAQWTCPTQSATKTTPAARSR
jgi:hypothetical protein